MAMNFARAERATPPDLLNATIEQGRIAAALRQAEQQRKQGNMAAAAQFGQMAPEGVWSNFGGEIMNTLGVGAEAAPAAGEMAAGADAMIGMGELGATVGEVGSAAEGLAAAEGIAAGSGATTAAGSSGLLPSLGALGPWGWLALAAMGAAAM